MKLSHHLVAATVALALGTPAVAQDHPVIKPIEGFVPRPAAQQKVANYDEFRFRRKDAQGRDEFFFKKGKTDSTGTDEHNLDLSRRRADTVKAYLMLYGISQSRLETTGLGESKPVGEDATEEGRALNRRVELHRMG